MQQLDRFAAATRAAVKNFPTICRRSQTAAALLLVAVLSGCWTDGPVPSEEEEELEIIFGSTVTGGGRLVTDYDFGVPVLVDFNTELGGFTVYSGVDPGFVSLDRSIIGGPEGLFPLPAGMTVGIRITEIDPGVQITVGNTVLAAEGDAATLGQTPIHMHPQWQLIYPSGEIPPPHFVSFVLTTTAEGYTDSEPYTATITVELEE